MRLSLTVAMVSAAALGFEVLLVRLFAIVHWHHFAFMVISLALLGYGASGTALFLLRDRMVANFERWFFALHFDHISGASTPHFKPGIRRVNHLQTIYYEIVLINLRLSRPQSDTPHSLFPSGHILESLYKLNVHTYTFSIRCKQSECHPAVRMSFRRYDNRR